MIAAVESSSGTRRARATRRLAFGLVVCGAVAAGWWAARATLVQPAQAQEDVHQTVTATVAEATVGRSVTYNVTVTQAFAPVASNALAGTVTHLGGAEVGVGDELYSVDGVAVRVVGGRTPFWRDLAIGVVGPDVAQLERALVALGHLEGDADDTYTAATYRAVWAWQKATGRTPTGVVPHGEVVAVPHLPTTVQVGDAVRTGLVLVGGEPVILTRPDVPEFELVLMPDQAAQVPPDAEVGVTFADRMWPAVVTTTIADDGSHHLTLASPDGGPVCGQDCASLPAQETVSLMADVALVPGATGAGVPAAAVRTDDAGRTYVLRPDGSRTPVGVTGAGDGIAIVDGLAVGDTVVVLDGSLPTENAPTTAADDGR